MKYSIIILPDAKIDILEIYEYVALHDGVANAESLLDNIESKCYSLDLIPERGHIVPELKQISVNNYREIHFKPYRIVYQIIGTQCFVHCVLDGRRDLKELLEQRLLRF